MSETTIFITTTILACLFAIWQFIQRCRADREACEWELVADELAEGVCLLNGYVRDLKQSNNELATQLIRIDDNQGGLFK